MGFSELQTITERRGYSFLGFNSAGEQVHLFKDKKDGLTLKDNGKDLSKSLTKALGRLAGFEGNVAQTSTAQEYRPNSTSLYPVDEVLTYAIMSVKDCVEALEKNDLLDNLEALQGEVGEAERKYIQDVLMPEMTRLTPAFNDSQSGDQQKYSFGLMRDDHVSSIQDLTGFSKEYNAQKLTTKLKKQVRQAPSYSHSGSNVIVFQRRTNIRDHALTPEEQKQIVRQEMISALGFESEEKFEALKSTQERVRAAVDKKESVDFSQKDFYVKKARAHFKFDPANMTKTLLAAANYSFSQRKGDEDSPHDIRELKYDVTKLSFPLDVAQEAYQGYVHDRQARLDCLLEIYPDAKDIAEVVLSELPSLDETLSPIMNLLEARNSYLTFEGGHPTIVDQKPLTVSTMLNLFGSNRTSRGHSVDLYHVVPKLGPQIKNDEITRVVHESVERRLRWMSDSGLTHLPTLKIGSN